MNGTDSTEELEAGLGEQIRAARLRRNLGQDELAEVAGVALGSLRNLEKGRGATVATLVRIVKALGLTPWIMGLQPEVTISPIQMLKAKKPRQRARRTRKEDLGN